MNKFIYPIFFLLLSLNAEEIMQAPPEVKSPNEVQTELNQAQMDLEIAESMFNPWYTGPLIASSASNVPPGMIMLQPYVYLTTNYGVYNKHRHSESIPNLFNISPLMVFQTGITDWMDFTIVPQAFFKFQSGEFGTNIADTPIQLGFKLAKETLYTPKMRLVVGELFPTGDYQNLNPNRLGLDGTGEGAFQTLLGFNMSKVFWWSLLHPFAARLATSLTLPNHRVDVHEFNSFGGGYNTDGKVHIGATLTFDLGLEFSLTQRWVLATDIVYSMSGRNSFSGNPGVDSDGAPAIVGSPSSDQFSLAPAIEYNVNENSGFIGGVWFTVTGRNSSNFASVLLSYTTLF